MSHYGMILMFVNTSNGIVPKLPITINCHTVYMIIKALYQCMSHCGIVQSLLTLSTMNMVPRTISSMHGMVPLLMLWDGTIVNNTMRWYHALLTL